MRTDAIMLTDSQLLHVENIMRNGGMIRDVKNYLGISEGTFYYLRFRDIRLNEAIENGKGERSRNTKKLKKIVDKVLPKNYFERYDALAWCDPIRGCTA